jgi:hypothetical protein
LKRENLELIRRSEAASVCADARTPVWDCVAYNLAHLSTQSEHEAAGTEPVPALEALTLEDVPVEVNSDRPDGDKESATPSEECRSVGAVSQASADDTDRTKHPAKVVARKSFGSGRGLPGVEVTSSHAGGTAVHPGDWVCAFRKFGSEAGIRTKTLALPVAVRAADDSGDRPLHLPDASHEIPPDLPVDQVVRLALGIGVRETYEITPFVGRRTAGWKWVPRSRRRVASEWIVRRWRSVLQWLMPTVNVVARVQPAELTLTEQNACLLTPLALDAMGIESGSEVIVRAASVDESGAAVMTTKVIKAYATTDEVLNRRLAVYGGNRSAPLPSEEEALLVPQSLPWIWLDGHLRKQLCLTGPLTSVVVHPSRWFVIKDHSRELAVAAVVGGLTLGAGADGRAQVLWVGGSLVLALYLVAVRIRNKLR